MARAKNDVETEKLQLSTTPQVLKALRALVRTGKFGKTASEAAEELLRQKLRDVELDGWLDADGPAGARRRRR